MSHRFKIHQVSNLRPHHMNIAQAVVDEFNKLGSGFKPQTRSNGEQEWTVLAGICLVSSEVEVITLATGVKVLPEQVRQYSKGTMVMDGHAEMLALRAFNWWILANCDNPNYFDNRKLRSEFSVALYISEPPCGDALMSYISQDQPSWKRPRIDPVLRGRAHFNVVGVVRTKPGRADAQLSLVKLCLDKLTLKQALGINNAMSLVVVDPIFLNVLVVPSYKQEDFNRCFGRISDHRFEVELANVEFAYAKDSAKVAAAQSLIMVVGGPQEVLVQGAKRGAAKKNKPPSTKGQSKFCNWQLWHQWSLVIAPEGISTSYDQWKKLLIDREKKKTKFRMQLGNWDQTAIDDFPIA